VKKIASRLIAVSLLCGMLSACGGGGGGDLPPLVGATNLVVPVNARTVPAIAGQVFTIPRGVASFGTSAPTDVTLNTSTFTISTAGANASGTLTFGSCIFTVTNSTFAADSPLANGKTVTVEPCTYTVATGGLRVDGGEVARAISLNLGNDGSDPAQLLVDIAPNGTVTVNGVAVGTITLTPATGATGSGS
jgi:hypothetical protein